MKASMHISLPAGYYQFGHGSEQEAGKKIPQNSKINHRFNKTLSLWDFIRFD